MKKTYIKPAMIQYKIMGKQTLLNASYKEALGSTGVDGGSALSREGSLWDDDME